MSPLRRPFAILSPFLAGMVLLASACGGVPAAAPGGAAAPAGQAVSHTLTVAVPTLMANVDPAKFDSSAHPYYVGNLISTLVKYKQVPDGSKTLQTAADVEGEMAESWTVAPDGITFKLRSARSSAGNTLTAQDVKWTMDRALALKDFVTGILLKAMGADAANPLTVIDDHTVKLNGHPTSIALGTLALLYPGILDSTEAKKHATADDPWAVAWLATHSASFAAYEVDTFTPSQEIRMKANPNYWRGAPYYTSVIMRAVPDSSSRLQLLQSGEVDWARSLTGTDEVSLQGKPGITARAWPSVSTVAVGMDNTRQYLNNVKVRQAISYAIDRAAVVKGPFHNFATPAQGFFPAAMPQQALPGLPYDPAKAKALLTEAGYPNGIDLGLTYIDNGLEASGADSAGVAVLIASQLTAVGIRTKPETVASGPTFSAGITAHKFDLTLPIHGPLVPDPAYSANLWWVSTSPIGAMGYKNAKVDELTNKALSTPIGPERLGIIAQLNDQLMQDMPNAPLTDDVHYEAMKSSVNGYSPVAGDAIDFYWSKAS